MRRTFHLRPQLSHEAASFIAQLALRTTMPADDIETVRALLLHHPPHRILDALDRAIVGLVAEGRGPDFPDAHGDADAYLALVQGLRALAQVEHTYFALAA